MHYDAPVKLMQSVRAKVAVRERNFLQWLKKQALPLTVDEIQRISKVPMEQITTLIEGFQEDDRLWYQIEDGKTYYSSRI